MKKFLIVFICVCMICALPVVAFAEETDPVVEVTESAEIETEAFETEPTPVETEPVYVETTPVYVETYPVYIETFPMVVETTPATETEPVVEDGPDKLSVDMIVGYIQEHLEEISVIVTLILSIFYNIRKHSKLNKSIVTLNNNSVAVSENSAAYIRTSLDEMGAYAKQVTEYKDAMIEALEEIRRNDEQRLSLEDSLAEVSSYLKATRMANTELANELAELLILANIPNSKKDELYSRHLVAVNAIAEAERKAVKHTEVKENEDKNEA